MGINDILYKLNEINFDDTIKVFVPSLNRVAPFKPLSLQQQKEILKAGISSEFFNILEFNAAFNQIIEQNSLEKNIYRLSDRSVIAIAFRNKFTAQPLELDGSKIDLKQFENKQINFDEDAFGEFHLEEGPLKITSQSPLLSLDQTITKIQLTKIKNTANLDLTNIIGEMYVFEILKYIKSVQIGDIAQDLNLLSIEDRLKIIEQLPASIITKLNNLITEKFKKPEDDYLTINDIKLTLDARLFV
jgi:hypothetical protein